MFCCPRLVTSSLVVLAVTIQRQEWSHYYSTALLIKDGFTVCCSFTIITFYSIITKTITITDTQCASCVCVCVCTWRILLGLCVYLCVAGESYLVLGACFLVGEAGKSQ